jgi:hypothetical protein
MSKKATVMSGLALLAAGVSLALTIQETKRNQKRSAATCDYVENEYNAAIRAAKEYTDNQFTKAKEAAKKLVQEVSDRVKDLEDGVIPNHEDAKRAAESLNDFNRGIASIMGFDPFEAIQKEQSREGKQ